MAVVVNVPIPELSGLLTPRAAEDFPIGRAGSAVTMSRLFLSVLEAPSGGTVVGRIGTAIAGGGSGIETTIADGQLSGVATGTVALDGTETLYFRLVSATDPASDLSGWIEWIFAESADTDDDCSTEPITVDDAKAYLRVETTADDTLICALIHAARFSAESYLGRPILATTRTLYFDGWPSERMPWWDGVREGAIGRDQQRFLDLRLGGITSIGHVKTYDDADTATTMPSTDYYVDTERGRIHLRSGKTWPAATRVANAIEVSVTLGYADAAVVPRPIKQGLLVHVAALYENRENPVIPEPCKAFYQPYRVLRLR